MKGVEQGQLFYTGRTPGRPEVEQQGFASKRPHGQLGALGRVECLGPKCLLGARLHSAGLQAPPGQAGTTQRGSGSHTNIQSPAPADVRRAITRCRRNGRFSRWYGHGAFS